MLPAGATRQLPGPYELLISAAVSGIVTKTTCAPMDRLRLLYQIQGMLLQQQHCVSENPEGLAKARKPRVFPLGCKYGGVVESLRLVVREEGLRALWKGNGVNALRAAACYAIKFPANDLAKRALGSDDNNKNSSLGSLLLAGAIAGSLQKTFSYPLDVLSVRIAVGINAGALGRAAACSTSNSSNQEYAGVLDCVRRVWRHEGPGGFFKGYSLALGTGVPYVMLQMTFFDLAKRKVGDAAERRRQGSSWPQVLFIAAASGKRTSAAASAAE
ncbi:calcium-binding mitochondrial carrier protein SCaMC-1 [Cyclospora cayetanensis]|uniref:Calcium-binding mitochondrial carrier protein SCaMC-1 n=1 Tax=Cyclospora cayetanensis TaxID=88456 RepID=A0A6P6RSS9_9EIME|nr:calcium-binding mitochondrial carrier protein SCaMC-1 [Cyclospora cayetanensis]